MAIGFGAGATPSTGRSVVFIDPGHGGVDQGAIGITADGQPVNEKTVTLAIALKAQALLKSEGYQVILSRTADTLPGLTADDLSPAGNALTPEGVLSDLQRRIDRANASGAQLFLSIHCNASDEPSARGAETYYDSTRSFASDNLRWAQLVQQDLIAALHGQGYDTPDRGVIDDTTLKTAGLGVLPASYNHLVLLGPAVSGQLRPTAMPGALSEAFFLSNRAEATAAMDPAVQDLVARGYATAVMQFFAQQ